MNQSKAVDNEPLCVMLTYKKVWLNLKTTTQCDISDDLLLLPVSLTEWSHWWQEVASPLGKQHPIAAVSVSAYWRPSPGSGSCWYRSPCTRGLLVQLVGNLGPLFSPWLSYHGILSLTPVPCRLRGTKITCRCSPLSPFHTNSTTLLLSRSLPLSLGPPDTHGCRLPQEAVL